MDKPLKKIKELREIYDKLTGDALNKADKYLSRAYDCDSGGDWELACALSSNPDPYLKGALIAAGVLDDDFEVDYTEEPGTAEHEAIEPLAEKIDEVDVGFLADSILRGPSHIPNYDEGGNKIEEE